ncbi:MAG: DUF5320 domain-containing protein [Candidatus Bathyarchaeota archaeon]|nr:DUF5320 domain-containing protein [Candidatus Bathyarchaeota archaeon]
MPWGRRGQGNWPGAGPYSNLPPWQRPGWQYGRGACRYLYGSPAFNAPAAIKPEDEAAMLNQQKSLIEEQLKAMQEALAKIQSRLDELSK